MIESHKPNWRRVVVPGIAPLLVAALAAIELVGTTPSLVTAQPNGYVFEAIAFLGAMAPGPEGGTFVNDFEPGGLNNRGDILFGADVSTGGEGVFLRRQGQELAQLARAGEDAPGGGVFGPPFLGPTFLNDAGDVAFAFALSPFSVPPPIGVNAGVYRFSASKGTITPVVQPGVTPVPGGGMFVGDFFGPSLNNRGDIVFPGIVATDKGIHLNDPADPDTGLGVGLFKANKEGQIVALVTPGDRAPGGGTFDWTAQPWLNDGADVTFIAHIAGKECHIPGFPPQSVVMQCLSNLYVRKAATGEIKPIVRAGDPAPGGGFFRQAFGPMMNNRGDIVFVGDLTPPPDAQQSLGVFLHTGGVTIPVARPGDSMPGGGAFVTATVVTGNQIRVNNPGEVAFNALLVNGDGSSGTGLFVWSHGSLRLVARTGTVIPGVGTVLALVMGVTVFPPPPESLPNSGALNNDRGQVLFGATLSDGGGVLLLATPRP